MSDVLEIFDNQLLRYSAKLRDDLKIEPSSSNHLATTIFSEISMLPLADKNNIVQTSPISLRDRLIQIENSIGFNAICTPEAFGRLPGLAYAHTITLCYISFVYLSEPIYDAALKTPAIGSTCKRCVRFLRNNPVRAFRHALAHGNWFIKEDYITFWAKKGDKDEPMAEWNVSQEDLLFWYALARSTGYAILSGITA